jgi:hypothetical protein
MTKFYTVSFTSKGKSSTKTKNETGRLRRHYGVFEMKA